MAACVLVLWAVAATPLATALPPEEPAELKSASAPVPAAHSLDGSPLHPAVLSEEESRRLHADLAAAQDAFDVDPSEVNTIWLGRRLAYLQRYREAVDVFSKGLERFPQSYRLYRHRGHRHITLRNFDAAIADFERAYELMPKGSIETEPDGMPNARGIPLSNTQFNVLYHHALAHYLRGEWVAAERLWRESLDYADNPDLQVAARDWLYMTLRRQGEKAAAAEVIAAIPPDIEVIEDEAYLQRLRLYRGEISPEALLTDGIGESLLLVTQGYGVANWYLYEGQPERAAGIRRRILGTGAWAAFGYIAAEADDHCAKSGCGVRPVGGFFWNGADRR